MGNYIGGYIIFVSYSTTIKVVIVVATSITCAIIAMKARCRQLLLANRVVMITGKSVVSPPAHARHDRTRTMSIVRDQAISRVRAYEGVMACGFERGRVKSYSAARRRSTGSISSRTLSAFTFR